MQNEHRRSYKQGKRRDVRVQRRDVPDSYNTNVATLRSNVSQHRDVSEGGIANVATLPKSLLSQRRIVPEHIEI